MGMKDIFLDAAETAGAIRQLNIDRFTKEICPKCDRNMTCGRVDGTIPMVGKFHHKLLPAWRHIEMLKCIEKEQS